MRNEPAESRRTNASETNSSENSNGDGDALDPIREQRAGVERVAERTDDLGAAARVLLALADDDTPEGADLRALGLAGKHDTGAFESALTAPSRPRLSDGQVRALGRRVLAAARKEGERGREGRE
ncbi:hypothetical protein BRC90_06800 [Halobacteriales archaeon QS_4_69_34]|nr:MAG: hypothetical protein BRC90_06800 [Halobacteriales archaeon QS_4_69_34]